MITYTSPVARATYLRVAASTDFARTPRLCNRRLQQGSFIWPNGDANNAVENMMHPIALGRKNWFFIGSQQAGERAATLMSLIESAKLNGHDAWAYLKDVLTKLPTWPNSRLEELLPHRWVSHSST